ncbi:type II secretion system protein [Pseudoalteromonas sp. SG41-5]|nr:type II secretion system protein [Pseudoalteromonas sp. SG41-5]
MIKQSGFSLLEVMLSVVIAGIASRRHRQICILIRVTSCSYFNA